MGIETCSNKPLVHLTILEIKFVKWEWKDCFYSHLELVHHGVLGVLQRIFPFLFRTCTPPVWKKILTPFYLFIYLEFDSYTVHYFKSTSWFVSLGFSCHRNC